MMDKTSKIEELEEFVMQIHVGDLPSELVFDQAISALEALDLSHLLEALPIEERCKRWLQVPEESKVQVLGNLRLSPVF